MKFRKLILLSGLGVIFLLWLLSLVTQYAQQHMYPLHSAAFLGNTAEVKRLIDKGADVNEWNNEGITPLHAALAGPDSTERSILSQLLIAGADVNKTSQRGWTPLHFAAHLQDTMALRFLLHNGADIFFLNPQGKTAYELAADVAMVWRGISPQHQALNDAVLAGFRQAGGNADTETHHHEHSLRYAYHNRDYKFISHFLVKTRLISGGIFSTVLWMLLVISAWVIIREFVKNEDSRLVRILFYQVTFMIFIYTVWAGLILSFFIETAHIPSLSMYPALHVGDHIMIAKWHRTTPQKHGNIIIFNPYPEEELNKDVYVVKRIIGLPGDLVEVSPAHLYINGTEQSITMRGNVPLHAWLREKLGIERQETIKIDSAGLLYVSGRQVPLQRLADSLHVPVQQVALVPGALILNSQKLNEPYISEDMDYSLSEYEVPPGTFFLMGDNRNRSIDSHIWGAMPMERIVGKVQLKYLPFTRFGSVYDTSE